MEIERSCLQNDCVALVSHAIREKRGLTLANLSLTALAALTALIVC